MSNVIPFERTFDATDMSVNEIREKAREKGWPGVHIDTDEMLSTGIIMVTRLTRKDAYNE